MKKVAKVVSKKKLETKDFKITLTMGNNVYRGQGVTAFEALASMAKPEKIMSKGVVLVESEGKKKELIMMPLRLKRLFYNKIFQEIQAKWLGSGLK